jgi:Protein of unknown function (DUF3995)
VRKPRPALAAAANAPFVASHAAVSGRAGATARAATWAFAWTLAFAAIHGYWYLGGRIGFGDQADPLPGAPSSLGDWLFSVAVVAMFAAGLLVPVALVRPWGRRLPRRLLVWAMWAGCAVLALRGGSGLIDDLLRFGGLAEGGLTGLSNQQVLDSAHPSASTVWSTVAIDAVFLGGGVLFGYAARLAGSAARGRTPPHP